MSVWNDWRLLAAVSAITYGVWGLLAKMAVPHLGWARLTFAIVTVNAALIWMVTAPRLSPAPVLWWAVAASAGLCAAAGSVTLYRALGLAPASVVIPVSALYVIITAVLSVGFLHESLTPRVAAGIALGWVAVLLLAGGQGH